MLQLFQLSKLQVFRLILSLVLISGIFFRVPDTSAGLKSFATKSNLLGSPRAAQQFLNILTAIGILIYFGMTFELLYKYIS